MSELVSISIFALLLLDSVVWRAFKTLDRRS
jgi:hypothetical protein